MAKLFKLPFLNQGQEFVISANRFFFLFFFFFYLSANLLISDMVFIRGVQNSSVASHIKRLHSVLLLCCQGS